MVRKLENGVTVAPFLLKCYEMVDDESTDELISWSESYSNSFIIKDVGKFTSELLPTYFKHSNFASFIRQLNLYGFHKSDTDRWEFSNEAFVKGQKNLLKNIIRRKQSQVQSHRKSSQQVDAYSNVSEEDNRVDLRKLVEILKTDKNMLMQDLIKLKQHQQSSQSKLILLREQLKGMEKSQQQMLSFIVMAMQNPGIFLPLLHPKESKWLASETGKKIVTQVADDCEPLSSEGALVPYQLPMAEASDVEAALEQDTANVPQNSSAEFPMEFDLSDEFTDLLNIDFMLGPLDERFLPLESLGPLVLADIPDGDNMLEQFLLSSPPPDNVESDDCDTEVSDNPGTKMQSTVW